MLIKATINFLPYFFIHNLDESINTIKQNKHNEQITNNDENKLYLFDIDGSIKSNFPIFGSGQADITKNKKNEKLIAVKGDEKEILVYSLD